jgi:hypothetical protein
MRMFFFPGTGRIVGFEASAIVEEHGVVWTA